MRRTSLRSVSPACVLAGLLLTAPCSAWYGAGHDLATRMALVTLQGRVPDFWVQGEDLAAHCSQDPDAFKFQADSRVLYYTEYAEHYFDLERFDANTALPLTRNDFTWWCVRHGMSASTVGTLPYAVTEWTYRLAVALAEHRRWPEDTAIQAKALVYAGLLAHYAQDLCMPLHTTIHYDGRVQAGGSSPKTGIHAALDGLLEQTPTLGPVRIDPNEVAAFPDVLAAAYEQIKAGHGLVDRVYELEQELLGLTGPLEPGSAVAEFAVERLQATVLFTARIYATAWAKSLEVVIPEWHHRTQADPVTASLESRSGPGTSP